MPCLAAVDLTDSGLPRRRRARPGHAAAASPAATPELAERLILHLGVGIADVKLGDPPEKLVALLGEPDERESHGLNGKEQDFNYRSLGLRFDIS